LNQNQNSTPLFIAETIEIDGQPSKLSITLVSWFIQLRAYTFGHKKFWRLVSSGLTQKRFAALPKSARD